MTDTNCPHCGKMLGIEAVSKLMQSSRMSFSMTPHPGEFLGTGTVGGCIENIGKLLDAVGEEMGVKTHTIVEGLSCVDGAIKVDLLITRLLPAGEDAKP